ncbi:MAG: hypothetical protein IT233_14135 [Bacteroidia bacterium]|nr:hypothetical protein [Bacteroidia bacterium]
MRKLAPLLLSCLILVSSYAQIDKQLKMATWKIGKEKIIYENKITRLEGENKWGATNVGYERYEQIISEIEKDAEREMWTPEKKAETLETYKESASGGRVSLYIMRLTIDGANTDMFTVIIRDSTDKNEIYRKELKSSVPETPSTSTGNYWWNYSTVHIPNAMKGKIFIYVIDKLGRDNAKFKFEINI